MYKANLFLPDNEDQKTSYPVQVDTFDGLDTYSATDDEILTDYFINFNPNFLPVLDKDVLFNGEPFYEPINFGLIEIKCRSKKVMQEIAAFRYFIILNVSKEENKKIENSFSVGLCNNSIYQMSDKSIIIKPNDVQFSSEMI